MTESKPAVQIRIIVIDPPSGVLFALQKGRAEFVKAIRSLGETTEFDLSVCVVLDTTGARIDFRGPFVQGRRGSRFVYVNSGTYAGDLGSCWSRRAIVSLSSLPSKLIMEVLSTPGARLEASFQGVGKDGGPACASVRLLEPGWTITK